MDDSLYIEKKKWSKPGSGPKIKLDPQPFRSRLFSIFYVIRGWIFTTGTYGIRNRGEFSANKSVNLPFTSIIKSVII